MKITKISIFIIFIIQIGISNTQSETKIYEEISIEEKDFILKYQQKIKNRTKIYKKDANHIIALTPPVSGGKILLDFLAASHCGEFNKFAFRFKDSGKTRIYYNQIEAYHYRCSENIILKDSLSNSKVVWTNYDDKSFYKYPEKHLFLYRKKTKTFNKILKAAKKKDPSLFKPKLYRVYYKDKNTINILGKKISNNVPARKIAADHCAKYNKNVYYFEDDFYSGVKASMLFHCANKTFLSNPRTGMAVRFTNDSQYFIKLQASQQSMYKEEFKKYGAKSLISYYFFEASNDYLSSLELLYRAYDLNVQADEFKAQIEYNKNSKYSESQKLKSTKSLVDKGSIEIEAKLTDASLVLSDLGRGYYEQSLPYAFSAAQNTIQLTITFKNVVEGGKQDLLKNFGEIVGIFRVLPEIGSFTKNMNSTIKLVFGGAKEKKIRDKGNLNKALNELNLDS
tara:strand:- start:142 stop:1497 length:1356 start_codon:yes stop_codon:yes gene_type:complete